MHKISDNLEQQELCSSRDRQCERMILLIETSLYFGMRQGGRVQLLEIVAYSHVVFQRKVWMMGCDGMWFALL